VTVVGTAASAPSVLRGAWRCLHDPLAVSRLVRWRALAEHAPLARGLLLDVGAGQQPYAALFAPYVDRIVALEFPGPSLRDGVDVIGDAQTLPIRTGRVDTVLCVEVLEYLPDPRRAIAELARVLRPGGRLLLTAPQLRGESTEPDDYWRFGHPGLRLLARDAGLDEVRITPCGGVFAAYGQRVASWLHAAVTAGGGRHALARAVAGIVLVPSWIADHAGLGRGETLHWMLTARKP
jgi:SAM-dependent methyltransferase